MNIQLSENQIHERASEQSFQKGLEYYQSGAILNPTWQSASGGILIMASCEGNSAPSYRVSAHLSSVGINSGSCNCLYDFGGDCKHIVALLLTYLHQPGAFTERKNATELLSGLDKDALIVLVARLVDRNPDLYGELEIVIPAAKAASPKKKGQTQVSEQSCRKQVKLILKQNRYEDDDEYDDPPAYLDDLEEVQQTAIQFLDSGDPDGALIILRVLLEEIADDYDSDMDYNGDVASFIQSLGMPLAEAILSVEMDNNPRQAMHDSLEEIIEDLEASIDESDLGVATAAIQYGWDELPDETTNVGEDEDEDYDETWMVFDELQQARLNVLERQGRIDEFLQLAQKEDLHRYTLKLLQLGRVDDAIAASQELVNEREILAVAQELQAAGRPDEAIALAERSLSQANPHSFELAAWLAAVEEAGGNMEMALLASQAAFDVQPTLIWYRALKRLSGEGWENLRPALVKKVNDAQNSDTLADIYLEEQDWDAAIAVAEKSLWAFSLLEKVADRVISQRPDWVIRTSLKQADELIEKTQSKLYPIAAKWLAKAKKAYQVKGQAAAWQAYITNLRATYARRPALKREISNL